MKIISIRSIVGSVTKFAWRNLGKSRRNTVWIADIHTRDFPNVRKVCQPNLT